jgi:hypothetical protein
MARRLDLFIVEPRLDIKVHGFNVAKTYASKSVTIDVIVENKLVTVRALTIPKIRTNEYNSQLALVKAEFEARGHKMADEYFDSCIPRDIDILIGVDNATVLPFTQVFYGTGNGTVQSIYLNTPLGVVPIGFCTDILYNLPQILSPQIAQVNSIGTAEST